jgi:hypothetical protein
VLKSISFFPITKMNLWIIICRWWRKIIENAGCGERGIEKESESSLIRNI